MSATWGIVLAAGSGARFGAKKQFVMLDEERLIDRVVRIAGECCDGLVLVLPSDTVWDGADVDVVVEGGGSHAASTEAGLAAVPPQADVVVITAPSHPLISPPMYRSVIGAIRDGGDACVPLLPIADALKTNGPDGVRSITTSSRPHLAQLPFAFRRSTLDRAIAAHPDFVEELEAVEHVGGSIVPIPGDPLNLHVTTPQDLQIVQAILRLG